MGRHCIVLYLIVSSCHGALVLSPIPQVVCDSRVRDCANKSQVSHGWIVWILIWSHHEFKLSLVQFLKRYSAERKKPGKESLSHRRVCHSCTTTGVSMVNCIVDGTIPVNGKNMWFTVVTAARDEAMNSKRSARSPLVCIESDFKQMWHRIVSTRVWRTKTEKYTRLEVKEGLYCLVKNRKKIDHPHRSSAIFTVSWKFVKK